MTQPSPMSSPWTVQGFPLVSRIPQVPMCTRISTYPASVGTIQGEMVKRKATPLSWVR
jgi:hypothetical protein